MSITHALSNALSGLTATSRAADIVASNVANAMTEGYGRREIELSPRALGRVGAGVQVVGINRAADPVVIGERRVADGMVALEDTRINFYDEMARAFGRADDANSITGLTVGFETALIEAANNPESDAHLNSVALAADALTQRVNRAADTISDARMRADHDIGTMVETLQSDLNRIVKLNVEINEHVTSGYDASALLDQRQILIDKVSEVIPVKEVRREHGMVALYSPGGAILLDSKAAQLEFTPVNTITPDMNVGLGVLSGLTINGQPVRTDADNGPISGGKLAGLFEIRDTLAPEAQSRLDAFARDLMMRFEDPSVDATLTAGDPGIFTDAGGSFDALDEVGLANRLAINSAVDVKQGGEIWRFRDGVNAVSEGNAGDATLLQNMIGAIQSRVTTASGGFSSMQRSSADLSADLYSINESRKLAVTDELAFFSAQQTSLKSIEREQGVDTDREMQELLLIEQTYAANAKVISTVDELLDQLMRAIG